MAALLFTTGLVLASCGPNDHLRDDYMGKPSDPGSEPVEYDELGNPVL